jgi:hypothetical protein
MEFYFGWGTESLDRNAPECSAGETSCSSPVPGENDLPATSLPAMPVERAQGHPPAPSPSGGVRPYCPLCRRSPRQGEPQWALRFYREDGPEGVRWIPDGQPNACYLACLACIRRYTPLVRERLHRQGRLPAQWAQAPLLPEQLYA